MAWRFLSSHPKENHHQLCGSEDATTSSMKKRKGCDPMAWWNRTPFHSGVRRVPCQSLFGSTTLLSVTPTEHRRGQLGPPGAREVNLRREFSSKGTPNANYNQSVHTSVQTLKCVRARITFGMLVIQNSGG